MVPRHRPCSQIPLAGLLGDRDGAGTDQAGARGKERDPEQSGPLVVPATRVAAMSGAWRTRLGPLARERRVLGLYIGTIAGRHDDVVTFAWRAPSPDPLRNGALHKGCGSLGRATGGVRLLAMALLAMALLAMPVCG